MLFKYNNKKNHFGIGMVPELFNNLILEKMTNDPNVIGGFRYAFLVFPAYSLNAGFTKLCELVAIGGFCKELPVESQKVAIILGFYIIYRVSAI